MAELRLIVDDMAAAAAAAGVQIVTGDTKVVNHGRGDGLYITTAGVGLMPADRRLGPEPVQPGDSIVISGTSPITGWRSCWPAVTWPSRPTSALTPPPRRPRRDAPRRRPRHPLDPRPHQRRVGDGLQRAGPRRQPGRAPRRGVAPDRPGGQRGVRPARHRPAVCGQRGQVRRRCRRRRDRRRPRRPPGPPARSDGGPHRRGPRRPAGIVVLLTAFGGTRIVDMLVGDPLPRIC